MMEKYINCGYITPLQDRQAEPILATLVEITPTVLREVADLYNGRGGARPAIGSL